MKRTFYPGMFLGTVVLLCTAWLWARPPVELDTFARFAPTAPRAAPPVDPPAITLDAATLERFVGKYAGRGDFAVDLTVKDGRVFAQSPDMIRPAELYPISATEFFLKGPRYTVEFDVAANGTVDGFSVNTEFGLVEARRVR